MSSNTASRPALRQRTGDSDTSDNRRGRPTARVSECTHKRRTSFVNGYLVRNEMSLEFATESADTTCGKSYYETFTELFVEQDNKLQMYSVEPNISNIIDFIELMFL